MKTRFVFMVMLVVLYIGIVYARWIHSGEIIGGDWPYLFPEMVRDLSHVPSSWQSGYGGGMGGLSPAHFLSVYNFVSAWVSVITGLSWVIVSKALWFFFPVFLLACGTWGLCAAVLPSSRSWMRAVAAIVAATNTYVLMVAGGGQAGVFAAISLFPWVLLAFFRFLRKTSLKESLIFGVTLGLQISLDPRFAYISVLSMAVLYWFEDGAWSLLWHRIGFGFVSVALSIGLNTYWVLPLIMLRENTLDALGSAYTTVDALKFFSFADFSHSLSVLHPNWPENIFGKIYFLQPEFLVIPILAFAGLWFTGRSAKMRWSDRRMWGIATIALIGIFLAKGANAPFGDVYVRLFEYMPGFIMFRDPTKFYAVIVISYAVLIAYTLFFIFEAVRRRAGNTAWIVPVVFLLYWMTLILPVVNGRVGGTFARRSLPVQYAELKEFLQQQTGFYRVLWVPRQSRFAFTSPNELALESDPLLGATDAATLKTVINAQNIREHMAQLGIRYVIIPHDPYGELFTDDRKYSQIKRMNVEKVLDSVPWMTKVRSGDIAVYETPKSRDHFWLQHGKVTGWERILDDYYRVTVDVPESTLLHMSEAYHHGWEATVGNGSIAASKGEYGTIQFVLPQKGLYVVTIEFTPRRWYVLGRWISVCFLGLIVVRIVLFHRGIRK